MACITCNKNVHLHPMFNLCRKYEKLLTPIMLGLFFAAFVMDDYSDGQRMSKGLLTEYSLEIDADETDCEGDNFTGESGLGLLIPAVQEVKCVFTAVKELPSCPPSAKQFRGLVRRYAPNPASIYTEFFHNGIDFFRVYAIFYFDNQIFKQ